MDLSTTAPSSDLQSEQINKLLGDDKFRTVYLKELAEDQRKFEAEAKNILDQMEGPNSEDKVYLLFESLFIHEDCLDTIDQFKSALEMCELGGLTLEEEKKLEITLTAIMKLYNASEQL